MRIKTKIKFGDYVKLLFSLAYEKTILRLLLGFAMLLLLWIIFYYLDIFDLPKPQIYQYFTLILISVVQPVAIFLTIRRSYYSSNQLMEALEMEISSLDIKINGESYYMEVKWDKFFKIVEKENWFLLYQNNFTAIIIPKKNINENDIDKFRDILQGVNNVPLELMESSKIAHALNSQIK